MWRVLKIMLMDVVPEKRAVFAFIALTLILVSAMAMVFMITQMVAWATGLSREVSFVMFMAIYGAVFGLYSWISSAIERAAQAQKGGG